MTRPRMVEILHVFAPARDAHGVLQYFDRGETPLVDAQDAMHLTASGAARFVDGVDASVPTGNGRQGDEGEAGDTDVVMPLTSLVAAHADPASRVEVRRRLDELGIPYNGRLGVQKLAALLPE